MDIKTALNNLAARIPTVQESLHTEEATKNALVMPFIRALGYDVFNPEEVVPEFTADVLSRKAERVDYAIMQDGNPIILIECKCCGNPLDINNAHQLYRYFTAASVKIGILTDGIIYKFFTDLDDRNKMDQTPFLVFNLLDFEDTQIQELAKISKEKFDLESALLAASDLKYLREIKKVIAKEVENPSDDLIRVLVRNTYSGRMTQNNLEYFRAIVKSSFRNYIKDVIKSKFSSVMEENKEEEEVEEAEELQNRTGIVTLEEEVQGYHIVRAILSEVCPPDRVIMRDMKNFCNILLDDTLRKPLCRFFFHSEPLVLGLFDQDKNLEKVEIEELSDIFKYGAKIKETFQNYEKKQ